MDKDVQEDPPSSVVIPHAPSDGFRLPSTLGPTATQCVAVSHETLVRPCVPMLLTVRSCHVVPPSLLAKMIAPTATQNVVVGQATELRVCVPVGVDATVHVTPPSEVVRMAPPILAMGPGTHPTATHCVDEVHATDINVTADSGNEPCCQVEPPSDEYKALSWPTATQSDGSPQATPMSPLSGPGRATALQVEPPSSLTAAMSPGVPPVPFSPTATHCDDDGQDADTRACVAPGPCDGMLGGRLGMGEVGDVVVGPGDDDPPETASAEVTPPIDANTAAPPITKIQRRQALLGRRSRAGRTARAPTADLRLGAETPTRSDRLPMRLIGSRVVKQSQFALLETPQFLSTGRVRLPSERPNQRRAAPDTRAQLTFSPQPRHLRLY
jgi:hypothetical protein